MCPSLAAVTEDSRLRNCLIAWSFNPSNVNMFICDVMNDVTKNIFNMQNIANNIVSGSYLWHLQEKVKGKGKCIYIAHFL